MTRRAYWSAADEHERANGSLFKEIEFALPVELDERQQQRGGLEFRCRSHRGGAIALHAGDPSRRRGESPRLT